MVMHTANTPLLGRMGALLGTMEAAEPVWVIETIALPKGEKQA